MSVILISPASRVMNHFRPPLALMYLSGYIKKNGVSCRIADMTLRDQVRTRDFYSRKARILEETARKCVDSVVQSDCSIVGITCYTTEIAEVTELAQKIKSGRPGVKIVVGGIHPTLYPLDFFKNPGSPFDFCVIGEGEVTLLELSRAVLSGAKDFSGIKGIAYRDEKNCRPVVTRPRPLAEDLDALACPDYDDLDMAFYTTSSPYAIRGVFTRSFYVSSSRGCPSSCAFCVSRKLREERSEGPFVRLRSPESLFEEIARLRRDYAIDSFYFIDDLFTLRKEHVLTFCRYLKKSRLPLIWGCSSKVNTVDPEMLAAMRWSGCVQIDFGVERGSDASLRALKKGITVAQIKKTFALCHDLGIRTFANMLVNVPDETSQDLEDVLSLVRVIRPEIVSFNVFTPYPGCEIFDQYHDRFTDNDYPRMMESPYVLIRSEPGKYRFARHDTDLESWVRAATKRYNAVLPNIRVFFDPWYLRSLLWSARKMDYGGQAGHLFREFINQKFL